jgi:hypothetical protein
LQQTTKVLAAVAVFELWQLLLGFFLQKFMQLQLESQQLLLTAVNTIPSCCSVSVIDVLSSAVGIFSVYGNLAAAFEFLEFITKVLQLLLF